MSVFEGLGPSVVCSPENDRAGHLRAVAASTAWWHCDVTDGSLAPETPGFTVDDLKQLRSATGLPIELHVLSKDPVPAVAAMPVGIVDCFSIHAKYLEGPGVVEDFARAGKPIALVLERNDPVEVLDGLMQHAFGLGYLTVTPGSTGERLDEERMAHVEALARYRDEQASNLPLMVDGGVKTHNVAELVRLGVNGVVSGSGVFATSEPPRAAAEMRAAFAS